jgi:hypothetical protein
MAIVVFVAVVGVTGMKVTSHFTGDDEGDA